MFLAHSKATNEELLVSMRGNQTSTRDLRVTSAMFYQQTSNLTSPVDWSPITTQCSVSSACCASFTITGTFILILKENNDNN